MSNPRSPDFSKDEIRVILDTLKEHFGHDAQLQPDDTDMRLNPALTEMTLYPIAYREIDDCRFVVARNDKHHFLNHFNTVCTRPTLPRSDVITTCSPAWSVCCAPGSITNSSSRA